MIRPSKFEQTSGKIIRNSDLLTLKVVRVCALTRADTVLEGSKQNSPGRLRLSKPWTYYV